MSESRDALDERAADGVQAILVDILRKHGLPIAGNHAIVQQGMFGIYFDDSIGCVHTQMRVMSEFLRSLSLPQDGGEDS